MKNTIRLSLLVVTLAGAVNVQAQLALTNGLVAYYPFNGNGNDASGNTNNAGLINCTFGTNRFGFTNASCQFNGVNASGTLPALAFGSNFTISAWFKFNTFQTFQRVFDFANGAGIDNIILGQDSTTSEIRFELDGGSGGGDTVIKTTAPLQAGRFYQAVCVLTNGQTMALYLNGQLVVSQNLTITYRQNTRTNNLFGKSNFTGSSLLNGSIDGVRIYNIAFTTNEIYQLYQFESAAAQLSGTAPALRLNTTNLFVGGSYQLQISTDLTNWANYGSPFTATSTNAPQYVDEAASQGFFRIFPAP